MAERVWSSGFAEASLQDVIVSGKEQQSSASLFLQLCENLGESTEAWAFTDIHDECGA